ncbi:ABC transporter [Pusillimonas caeni]|uniref:ABC-type transport auxiliary lipoprotein family protein n=1 Tax=Pusillimonas caeni TaxID=1348472 RepID=UPI000E59BFAE|nr:ABC-type transport auxiliary lipoprotein family protein [Pusillimonas caeni]TFL13717.1 ABC transporter [Pusillimonas caeni]
MRHSPALARHIAKMLKACVPAVLLALSGCAMLPASETLTFYRLPDAVEAADAAAPRPRLPAVLRVATPYGNRAVDSTRILVVPEADRVSAYKGARWSDTAPVLLRDRLIQSFRDAGVFRSVVADSGNLGADLELSSDLSQFHVIYRSGSPVAVVALDATLVEPASSRILASRRFHAERAVQGKEVPEVVQAFGFAVDELTAQLLAWSREQAPTSKETH